MASKIKVNAGEFAHAVKFATGRVNKKRKKPMPLFLEGQPDGKLHITDATYHAKGMAIDFDGAFDQSLEVDGRQLSKIVATYPADAELVICIDDQNFIIQYQKSKLSMPRIDQNGRKTTKKSIPHKKPPPQKPTPLEKRAEFNDTWGFSARVPMPAEAVKDEDK